ncbi:MAG TPA: hypothetical protein VLV16_02520 [Gemmatimonadales bacterium]|nr:hypothetical protein [Gemmatimonadales bacterium]
MPDAPRWAQIRGDVNYSVRRGAWYSVLRITPDAAVLEVGQRSVSVPRAVVEVTFVRPREFSVVPRPYDAVDLPISWGARYAVCPSCKERLQLRREQNTMQCTRCGESAGVNWSTWSTSF